MGASFRRLAQWGAAIWPRWRATLLALALFLQAVQAIPQRALQERDVTRAEYEPFVVRVERLLSVIGVQQDRSSLNQALIRANASIVETRGALLAPVAPLVRLLGSDQQWTLFLSANRDCFRLIVDGQNTGSSEYHTFYRALQSDEAGLAPLLTYRRTRALYNAGEHHGPSGTYQGLASSVSRELFALHPELERVRWRVEHLKVAEAGQPLRSLGMEHELIRTRGQP